MFSLEVTLPLLSICLGLIVAVIGLLILRKPVPPAVFGPLEIANLVKQIDKAVAKKIAPFLEKVEAVSQKDAPLDTEQLRIMLETAMTAVSKRDVPFDVDRFWGAMPGISLDTEQLRLMIETAVKDHSPSPNWAALVLESQRDLEVVEAGVVPEAPAQQRPPRRIRRPPENPEAQVNGPGEPEPGTIEVHVDWPDEDDTDERRP